MGTVHNRPCGNRSLVPAGTALVNVAAMNGIVFHTAALRADKPIGKAQAEQLCSASVLGIVATAKLFESISAVRAMMMFPFLLLGTL